MCVSQTIIKIVYLLLINNKPSAEFTPMIVGTNDTCLKLSIGWWQINALLLSKSQFSTTGWNSTNGKWSQA